MIIEVLSYLLCLSGEPAPIYELMSSPAVNNSVSIAKDSRGSVMVIIFTEDPGASECEKIDMYARRQYTARHKR